MTTVSIIGNGNMGSAIGAIVAAGGNSVEVVGRDASDPITGDIVVLAVPHFAIDEIVAARGADLAGKVVVDITNPLNFETFDSLVVPADGSATTVLIAGDDDLAKQALADVVRAGGLNAVDAGSLARARELESVGFLQLTAAVGEKIGWTGGFALVAA